MATHPDGVVVDIVGIKEGSRGCSCEHHAICGNNIILDCVVRLRKVQIVADDGHEETAVAAYWVSDGVDLCQVGFLPLLRTIFDPMEPILLITHSETSSRDSVLHFSSLKPPFSTIQSSQQRVTRFLNGLPIPTSTG
jgi:hypothetical protein